MAKSTYKLPYSINVTVLNSPISLKRGDAGLKKPVPLGIIILWAMTVIIYVYFVSKVFSQGYGIFNTILTGAGLLLFVYLITIPQEDGSPGWRWVKPTIMYWANWRERFIKTRDMAGEYEVAKLQYEIPLDEMTDKDVDFGIMRFVDGSVGVAFEVIGYGSNSLFDDQRARVIDTYATYLRQLKPRTTVAVDSRQQAQDVSEQLKYLKDASEQKLAPSVMQIVNFRQVMLKRVIGKQFKSTHQVFYLRAENEDRLASEIEWFKKQANLGMLREYHQLQGDELIKELCRFYRLD